jgi:hypothetical protein
MLTTKERLLYEFHKPRHLRYFRKESGEAVLEVRRFCESLVNMDATEIDDVKAWERDVDFELRQLEFMEQLLAGISHDDLDQFRSFCSGVWHWLRWFYAGHYGPYFDQGVSQSEAMRIMCDGKTRRKLATWKPTAKHR